MHAGLCVLAWFQFGSADLPALRIKRIAASLPCQTRCMKGLGLAEAEMSGRPVFFNGHSASFLQGGVCFVQPVPFSSWFVCPCVFQGTLFTLFGGFKGQPKGNNPFRQFP